ncbi:MAG TPA: hypothetical protein VGO80_10540 [Solirubrobacteraceae bacterium]|jgi:hypothetical protein|nr:hypothetical protein [Solirubrobacteraceae bacterium]
MLALANGELAAGPDPGRAAGAARRRRAPVLLEQPERIAQLVREHVAAAWA